MDCNSMIRWCGVKKIVFGLLLLLNAFVWPLWEGIDGWVAWLAVLFVLCGLYKLLFPMCPSQRCDMGMMEKKGMSMSKPMKKSGRKRRR